MTCKPSRRLVVDASVARAAGDEHEVVSPSKECREFLKAIRSICHRIVMTPAIATEWNKHQSDFARKWRVHMEKRGSQKIVYIKESVQDKLRAKFQHLVVQQESDRDAMVKDIHLIEAARLTDYTVVSLDEKVRKLFARATSEVGELADIVWVNPNKAEEQPIDWLRQGARPEKERLLNHYGIT